MRTLFYLSQSQMERISPFFPRSHGIPVSMTGASSVAFFTLSNMASVEGCSCGYVPYKTLYNRFVRWSRLGVFSRLFTERANQTPFDGSLMITPLTSRSTARRQACAKKGLYATHRPDKGRIEFQTPCGLRRTWAACSASADRRTGQRLQGSGHSPARSSRRGHLSGADGGMMRPGCGSL